MAFPTSDRWYQDEYEPPAILAMRAPLCAAYQRPAAAFGCRGDTDHTSGYHRSRSFIVNSPYSTKRLQDESIQYALDTNEPDWSLCSAFDFVPGSWGSVDNRVKMAQLTQRLLNAARARDPRLSALREIAGTLDGRNVTRFRCSDGVILSPFDSSHLDHIHGSFWRSRAKLDHSGIVQIMIGDEMLTPDQQQQLNNIHDWLFDFCRGLVAADPGTPHITEYVPNKWSKAVHDRPPATFTPEQLAQIAADLAPHLMPAFVAALQSPEGQAAITAAANRAEDE
jgi:hypothetical protein